MNIQAINSAVAPRACQPIKPVSFAQKDEIKSKTEEIIGSDAEKEWCKKPEKFSEDVFTPSEPSKLEQKYDMACLMAGYYKTQYENLLKEGKCSA